MDLQDSHAIEISGKLPWVTKQTTTLAASCAPFNSGKWEFTYGASTADVRIECKGVTKFVEVKSVTLFTSFPTHAPQYDRSTNVATGAQFPPSGDWVRTFTLSRPAGYNGTFRLNVTLVPPFAQVSTTTHDLKTIASRNAGMPVIGLVTSRQAARNLSPS